MGCTAVGLIYYVTLSALLHWYLFVAVKVFTQQATLRREDDIIQHSLTTVECPKSDLL
jgi:hypothetical protein